MRKKTNPMNIIEPDERQDLQDNLKLEAAYRQFEALILELKKRALPDEIVARINDHIQALNAVKEDGKVLKKEIRKQQTALLRMLEKELKIVTKNHYRSVWLAVGMSAFGLPLGAAIGISLGNMAFLGIGLPIGMVIGMGMGAGMDKKAAEEGRQLDIEIKF